ncbi:hypothetical protein JRQ81_009594 [Phrynocephalus forsythii]|uniref:Uncharacterized protein n=1 Tax=Phrynocephalus forsythii TaxID=171643 RepID=A0A9Q0XA65_9SAUR|nr:hypothetical protein JRQ81_009594 [Phrynocephalus forsythii]
MSAMSAKLARLEEQEKAFLAAHPQGPKLKSAEGGSGRSSSGVGSLPQEQKVAKRRPVDPTSNKALGEEEGALGNPGEKRKKKKKKKREEEETARGGRRV